MKRKLLFYIVLAILAGFALALMLAPLANASCPNCEKTPTLTSTATQTITPTQTPHPTSTPSATPKPTRRKHRKTNTPTPVPRYYPIKTPTPVQEECCLCCPDKIEITIKKYGVEWISVTISLFFDRK